MNKKSIGVVLAVLILAVVFGFSAFTKKEVKDKGVQGIGAASAKDATYKIGGRFVTLKNGVSEVSAAPGSASKVITRYFGNEVTHDFDEDGREDVMFLLSQETGGSGVFYYVVAALNTASGYVGSEGLYLGDRIAPQTTGMGKGNIVVVNYADRNPGEPFTTRPSLGKSIWVLLNTKTMQLGEVVQNFEGEADPARMSLGMKTWDWMRTTYNNDAQIEPRVAKKFTITFNADKTFSATTDCNNVGGNYSLNGKNILFSNMVSTMMYCEGSQEADFTKMLGEVSSYHFTSRGELIFDLKFDTGVGTFR